MKKGKIMRSQIYKVTLPLILLGVCIIIFWIIFFYLLLLPSQHEMKLRNNSKVPPQKSKDNKDLYINGKKATNEGLIFLHNSDIRTIHQAITEYKKKNGKHFITQSSQFVALANNKPQSIDLCDYVYPDILLRIPVKLQLRGDNIFSISCHAKQDYDSGYELRLNQDGSITYRVDVSRPTNVEITHK